MKTDILIIGGGLAGLRTADLLHQAGRDFQLVEARSRLGGRIKTEAVAGQQFDLGPAWYWPGQPRVAHLVDRFSLTRFEQFSRGMLVFEDQHGNVQHGQGYAPMQGSFRIAGGLGTLADALVRALPDTRLHRNTKIEKLVRKGSEITASAEGGAEFICNKVVLALPPRIVASQVSFSPALPANQIQRMADTPTWMAGQAKAVAVYSKDFWREAGLSGDAISRRGPMVEIHDASPIDGELSALFGFIGVPAQGRGDVEHLKREVLDQLVRMFGPSAGNPNQLLIKDWAADPFTAAPRDHEPLFEHPRYGMPPEYKDIWDGNIRFGGTEVAREFGGFLEGALEAAENAVEDLK